MVKEAEPWLFVPHRLRQPSVVTHSAASGPAAVDATAALTEKTNFDIKLEKYNDMANINIIKEVRSFTDLGLKEAKELVEKFSCVLKKGGY
ncbi:hypothetical protein RYX36_036179 [Vicia faba]